MGKKKILEDSSELITKIRKEYLEEVKSIKELADIYSCSTSVIQRFLSKHGIKRNESFNPAPHERKFITEQLALGRLHKDIASDLEIKPYLLNRYINRELLHKGKYSNKLFSNTWILKKEPLFWYFLGLFSADGHLGTNNVVSIFQKDGKYLKKLQKLIGHNGKLYGKEKTCYTLNINSPLLHGILEEYGFAPDKRYNAPFIVAPSIKEQWLFIRGLFDGDGSMYYNYVSGRFEGLDWQICSGSKIMAKSLYNFLVEQGLTPTMENCISGVGNPYYHVCIRKQSDVEKLFNVLYADCPILCLHSKYKRFLKLTKLIDIHKQVDDIVDAV